MSSLESKLYSVLSGSTTLTALVSSNIYPEHRTQADALPAVVYARASGLRVNSLSGYSGLENASVDVTCYALTVDSRRSVGDAVIGAMTSATSMQVVLNDSPSDYYDDEVQVYERNMTFSVWNRD
jgi:hypothetical protein